MYHSFIIDDDFGLQLRMLSILLKPSQSLNPSSHHKQAKNRCSKGGLCFQQQTTTKCMDLPRAISLSDTSDVKM